MSWLISLILASVAFTSDSSVGAEKNYKYTPAETTKVIRLDETERFEQTYPLDPTGRVSVVNVNGSITIDTWERSEVRLEAVKTADRRERLSEVEIRIDARPDSLRVETDHEAWNRRNQNWKDEGRLTVDYRLTVPRNAVLNAIETVNGSVTISNAYNVIKASSVNGQVRALNLRGTTDLSTVNGTVEANLESLKPGSKVSLNTVNGQVNLTIPSDSNATVKADTVNGSIHNDFGLPVRKGQYVGQDLYGRIGSGETQIRLSSVNGGLHIRRRNDGKSLNPSTNLLPTTGGETTSANVEAIKSAKINREINREITRAQREAAKEIKKMQPELAKIAEEVIRETNEALRQVPPSAPPPDLDGVKDQQNRQRQNARVFEALSFTGAPAIEKKTDTFTVKGVPRVTVEARDCAITVRGWDRPEVHYSMTRISRSRSAKPVDLRADAKDSAVNIKVVSAESSDGGGFGTGPHQVRLEVFVPKKSNLRIHGDGEIRLENISGEIELEGADESINIRDVDGRLRISAADARIRVIGFRGEIEAKTVDGEMSLEGDFQKVNAQTVEGTIILTLPENINASIISNLQDLQAEGFSLVPGGAERNGTVYKIGKGGEKFRLYTSADGRVFIRSASLLRTSY